jgi:hypothetical protein
MSLYIINWSQRNILIADALSYMTILRKRKLNRLSIQYKEDHLSIIEKLHTFILDKRQLKKLFQNIISNRVNHEYIGCR